MRLSGIEIAPDIEQTACRFLLYLIKTCRCMISEMHAEGVGMKS